MFCRCVLWAMLHKNNYLPPLIKFRESFLGLGMGVGLGVGVAGWVRGV